jgi:hypothetical protein
MTFLLLLSCYLTVAAVTAAAQAHDHSALYYR